MNIKLILIVLIITILTLPDIAVAKSSYGKIDVYYNDEILPGTEVAKPSLKIGEPFKVRIDLTVYQTSFVNVELTELGENNYEIISGPTKKMGDYTGLITIEENFTHVYEWKVRPTENWVDGSMPINLHYEILDPSSPKPLVSSKFTVAVPYITTEHYKGDTTPITTTDPESPTSTDDPTTPSTPAFTLLAAALALTIAARRS